MRGYVGIIKKTFIFIALSCIIMLAVTSCAKKRFLVIDDPDSKGTGTEKISETSEMSETGDSSDNTEDTEINLPDKPSYETLPETMETIDGVPPGEVVDGSLVFELDSSKTYYIVVDYTGAAESVSIPATHNGKPVREIGERAFENSIVSSVIIPSGVDTIGDYAFYYCAQLEAVTLPDSVTYMGEAAFAQCHSLASVDTGKGLKYVGAFAFLHCRNLSDIYLSSVIDYIGDDVFQGTAYYNNEANWKKGVLYVDNYLIEGKTDIEGKLFVGTHQTRLIAANAFYGANKITHVDISHGVSTICQGAFSNCTALKSINISMYYGGASGITRIEDGAFASCDALDAVFYSGDRFDEQGHIIRNDIDIGENNEALKNATWYEYSPDAPTKSGNFWHYVDGVPTPW